MHINEETNYSKFMTRCLECNFFVACMHSCLLDFALNSICVFRVFEFLLTKSTKFILYLVSFKVIIEKYTNYNKNEASMK